MSYSEKELLRMSRDNKFMAQRWKGRAGVLRESTMKETDPKIRAQKIEMYKKQLEASKKYDKLSKQ